MKKLDQLLLTYRQWQFTPKKQQALLEDLANLLEDGVSLNVALELMIGFAHSDLEVEIIRRMQLKMAEGESFVLGMEGWCPIGTIEIIRAGEEGGTLVESIRMAAEITQKQNEALGAIVQSMLYPTTMFLIGLIMLVYIGSTIFPNFEQIKPAAQWPDIGRLALSLSYFIRDFWWLMLLIILASVWSLRYLSKNYIGEFRPYLDQAPPFSLYRELSGARLMETLGLLLKNAIPLKQALKIAERNAPPYLHSHLLMMEFRLSGGRDNIADVLDTGLISSQDLARLRVVSLGKGFDEALIRQGKRSMTKSISTLKFAGKIMGGILMAMTASLVGLIFYAIYIVGLSLANT